MSGNYSDSTFSNPITKVGRVVYNVALDLSHARFRSTRSNAQFPAVDNVVLGAVTADHLTIQPHEICLEQDQEIFRSGLSRSINDTEIMLLSSLNGLKTNRKNYTLPGKPGGAAEEIHDKATRRRKVRERLRFGGVAATRSIYNPNSRIANDAIFVSQYGGLCTILNTGDDPIKAGNWVVWDLPRHPSEGTKMCGLRDKQMVITRPYSMRDMTGKTKIQHSLERDPEMIAIYAELAAAPVSHENVAACIHKAVELDIEERTRIIGRALQNAKTGETFDIQLGRYCA